MWENFRLRMGVGDVQENFQLRRCVGDVQEKLPIMHGEVGVLEPQLSVPIHTDLSVQVQIFFLNPFLYRFLYGFLDFCMDFF